MDNPKKPHVKTKSRAYVKGIDTIRCIFVIPIVLAHFINNRHQYGLEAYSGEVGPFIIGLYGLGIVFGISGFLIPYLLGLEKIKTGTINTKKFYTRRALRIFPVYYANVLFCLLIYSIFSIEWQTWDLMIICLYIVNIPYVFGGQLPFLGHYWTLAVEEQFYAVWPWLNKLSNKVLIKICWLLLIAFLIIRQLLIMTSPEIVLVKLMDHIWFQCVLIGVIFALYFLEHRTTLMKIAENKAVQWFCWGTLFFGMFGYLTDFALDIELTTAVGCMILVSQNSEKPLFNIEGDKINFIGKLTYGIYIYHYPVIFLTGELIPWEVITDHWLRQILAFTVIFTASTVMAHVSYKLIERPFLRIKEKKYTIVQGIKS